MVRAIAREELRKLFAGADEPRDFEQSAEAREDRGLAQVDGSHRLQKIGSPQITGLPPIRGTWASDIAVSDCSITSGSWVAQTTAAPVSRARRASRIATAIAFAPSSREVGSSARRTQRPRRDRPRDRHPRPLALREPRDALGRALGEPDRVERRERVRARLVAAAQGERQLDVLERGEVRDEAGLLADVGDLLAAERVRAPRGRARSARCRRRSPCRRPAARARRAGGAASSCRSRTGR